MARISIKLRSWLILFHRWLGVFFCLLFGLWFLSGMVMMYWSFPAAEHRISRAAALDAGKVLLSPEEAFARIQPADTPTGIHLAMLNGRAVYRFYFGRDQIVVFADNGETLSEVTPQIARGIAATWTGLPAASASFDGALQQPDQWTVNGLYRIHGNLLKYSWPNGEQVYVSPLTAEVVQHTTRVSRRAAYFGAIPHWLYFMPLRKDADLWERVVIWASGIGVVMSVMGLIIGIWMYSPVKRYRMRHGQSSFPYTGQKRWHAILGLIFGLVTCTWAFSGMMSLDPFPKLTEGGESEKHLVEQVEETLRGDGIEPAAFRERSPRQALAVLGPNPVVRELQLVSFAGEPFYVAAASEEISRVVPMQGPPLTHFDAGRITAAVADAVRPHKPAEVRLVTEYESYYVDRHHELPLPVLLARIDDEAQSMFYINPQTAEVVRSYSARSRWNRWLYHGLHSFDLPWLYRYRPLWDVLVLVLLVGGSALCFTSVVIGWQVVRRKLVKLAPRRARAAT